MAVSGWSCWSQSSHSSDYSRAAGAFSQSHTSTTTECCFKAMGYCRKEWVRPAFSKLIRIFWKKKKKTKHQQQYWANKVKLKARSCAVIALWSVDIKHLVYSMAVQLAHPRHRCVAKKPGDRLLMRLERIHTGQGAACYLLTIRNKH